jgi:DNA-binding LacI/PurR family transcriptional regulator
MVASARTATLSAIATEAGVSVSAVSKVLNGGTDVAADTRARIARLLRQHGYQVASQTGFAVADLLIGNLDSPWAEELIRGAVDAAAEAEVGVMVTTVTSPADFARWLELATRRGTRGALCVLQLPGAQELQRLAAARIPLVVIDPPEEPETAIRSVGTTNWQGGMQATRHLIELGHRRIGAIGQEAVWSGRARLAGYRAAMLAAGLGLELADAPTAIVAGNDAQAFGVLQALAERGLRAPDDVSVIGFDDVPVASWATPALTTVRQPLAAMAAAAFRMLSGGVAAVAQEPHHLELATSLVIRESTAPPPARQRATG